MELLLALLFFILIILGAPVAFAMLIASLIILVIEGAFTLQVAPQHIYSGLNSFSLLAIPLFILAGQIMTEGGLTKKIINFSKYLIGNLAAGLAHTNILASILFAGISGSAVADTAGIGSILIPAMVDEGYDKDVSTAITAASSIIGPIIPPSITMILYALIAGESVAALFLAGVIPGLLMGFGLMILVHFQYKMNPHKFPEPVKTTASFKTILKSFFEVVPALFTPIIIIGGVLTGVFTATESAGVAAIYSFLIIILYYDRSLSFLKKMPIVLEKTLISTGIVGLLIGVSNLFSWQLTIMRIPKLLGNALQNTAGDNTIIFLLLTIIILLFIGMFIETAAAMLLVTPVLLPIASLFNVDPLHYGFLIIFSLVIAMATPPVGVVLYVA
ncbi:MAG: TRAP transporter large permease, partial [bacterium]